MMNIEFCLIYRWYRPWYSWWATAYLGRWISKWPLYWKPCSIQV